MRALLQRVSRALVSVDDQILGKIGKGIVVFLGVRQGDDEAAAHYLADRVANLRIFEDSDGKTNLSALDVGAEILAVSQFTLYADCRRGRRPGFSQAARPEISAPLYELFISLLRSYNMSVAEGQFGAHMLVSIENEGPFTILLDSDEKNLQ